MNRTELATIATATADQLVTITYTLDGEEISFVAVSEGRINAKGQFLYRMSAEEKVEYLAPSRIVSVVPLDAPDAPADLFNNAETYTAGAVAAILDMAAKDLRVQLRSMGLNVGKGKRYEFTADEARTIAARVAGDLI